MSDFEIESDEDDNSASFYDSHNSNYNPNPNKSQNQVIKKSNPSRSFFGGSSAGNPDPELDPKSAFLELY
jgi:hypothetical protein